MLVILFLIYKISVIINILIWIGIKFFNKKRYENVEKIITNAYLPENIIILLIGLTIFVPILNSICVISEIIHLFETKDNIK